LWNDKRNNQFSITLKMILKWVVLFWKNTLKPDKHEKHVWNIVVFMESYKESIYSEAIPSKILNVFIL
jgi:hypothetical protein